MESTYLTARGQITEAQALAENYRQKWESGHMRMSDLEGTNTRCENSVE